MTPESASIDAEKICTLAPVVPVLVVKDPAIARPLAEALVAGGLPALEVTLRTPAALEVIAEMAKVDGGVVGAGTLLTTKDVTDAVAAGAKFGVSPGATTGGSSTSWKSGGAASSSPRLMMTPSGRVQDVSPVSVL